MFADLWRLGLKLRGLESRETSMRWKSPKVLALLGVQFLTATALAAPPEVTSLYPAGAGRGTTAQVTSGGTFAKWPPLIWVDGPGLKIEPAADQGKLNVTAAADALPGLYWVRLMDAEGASIPRPFLVGTLPEVLEQEPNDSPKKPQEVASSVIVNGKLLKANDTDHFAVGLKQGELLVASLMAHQLLGSPMDSVLQICSADGTVLVQENDSRGLDPQIVFVAPTEGKYLVRLFAFASEPNSSIQFAGGDTYIYRLTLTVGPFADHALPLAVQRGQAGALRLGGWNLTDAPVPLPIAPTDLRQSFLWQPENAAGLVPLQITDYPPSVALETSSPEQPQDCAIPASMTGIIESPKDEDVFHVMGVANQRLLIRIESDALGYELDPVLSITDDKGMQLAQQDDQGNGRDPELSFAPPRDEPLRIVVRDLYGRGGKRFVYRLTVVPLLPSLELSVAAGSFQVTPGKPLEIPITIDRRNGLAGEIEIRAVDLPTGVTADAVKSADQGETAKSVKLLINASAEAQSGMFRIVGTTAGEKPLVQAATFPVKLGDTTYPHSQLWLGSGK